MISPQIDYSPGLSPAPDTARWFKTEVLIHEPALRGYLRTRYPTIFDTEDLIQEAYLRFWRSGYSGVAKNVRSLLFAVARNAALDLIRRRQKSPIVDVCLKTACRVCDDAPSTADRISRTQEKQLLREAISTLAPRQRMAIELTVYEGLPAREAGTRMRITDSTVAQHVFNAKKACTVYFQDRGLVSKGPDEAGP